MDETPEQKAAREAEEAAVAAEANKVDPENNEPNPEGKEDRPEINYKKELERKNREIERLRQEREASKVDRPNKRDQNDLTTWGDHELKAVLHDPNAKLYHDQVNDILLERKVQSVREKERMQEKRALSDLELKTKYPEANDPSSEIGIRVEELMYELDLQKSPAGRLAAAKIAYAELNKGRSKSDATERKKEAERVSRVKGQMVDGDRSKSTAGNEPKKLEEIERQTKSEGLLQTDGFKQAMKVAGLDRDTFFPKR